MGLLDQELADNLSEKFGSAASAGLAKAVGKQNPIAGMAVGAALQMRISGFDVGDLAFTMPLKVILGGGLVSGPSETDLIKAAIEHMQNQIRYLQQAVSSLQYQVDNLHEELHELVDNARIEDLLKEIAEADRLFDSHMRDVELAARQTSTSEARRAATRILDSDIDQRILQIHDALVGKNVGGIGRYEGLIHIWTNGFWAKTRMSSSDRTHTDFTARLDQLRRLLPEFYSSLECRFAQALIHQARGIRLFIDANDALLGKDVRAADPAGLMATVIAPMIEEQLKAFSDRVEAMAFRVIRSQSTTDRVPDPGIEIRQVLARMDLFLAGIRSRVWSQAGLYSWNDPADDDAPSLRAYLAQRFGLTELGASQRQGDKLVFSDSEVVLQRSGEQCLLKHGAIELASLEMSGDRLFGGPVQFGLWGRLMIPGSFWKRYRRGQTALARLRSPSGAFLGNLPGMLRFSEISSRQYTVPPARSYDSLFSAQFLPFQDLPEQTASGAVDLKLERLDGGALITVPADLHRSDEGKSQSASKPASFGSFTLLRPGPSGMSC